ncbi:MAG: tRNA pseudouridine(55) synthase TruB [Polyangiales bacterium]
MIFCASDEPIRLCASQGGILIIDKPRGPTSHDVVAKIRRLLHTKAVGHAGTLDPMATGVLVVAVGEATKLVTYLTAHDKSYRATLRLGVTTKSFDADCAVSESKALDPVLLQLLERASIGKADARIDAALAAERARTSQVPPMISAIKVDGEPGHARVRRGEEFALPAREVAVTKLTLVAARLDPPELDLHVECTKGYYVRALARDLAHGLGTIGHLTSLRRLRSGPFGEDECVSLDAGEHHGPDRKGAIADVLTNSMIPLAVAAKRVLPVAHLRPNSVILAVQGKSLNATDFVESPPKGPSVWFDQAGERAVAIGELQEGAFRVIRGFRPPP